MLAIIMVVTAETRRMRMLVEDRVPYITVASNQTEQEIKFLFDTGSVSTIIAKDLLHPDASIYGASVNFTDSNLEDGTVESHGMVNIVFPQVFGSTVVTVHVMDRAQVGGEDGIFGFDLMKNFQMDINIYGKYIDYIVNEGQAIVHHSAGLNEPRSRKSFKTLSRKFLGIFRCHKTVNEDDNCQ